MRSMIEQYARDLTSGRLTFSFDHLSRVYFYAKKFAENYDDHILHAACFLYKIILGSNSKEDSAVRAEQILSETGFNIEKIQKVVTAIKNSDIDDKPESLEARMLHDAIIADSLGAIGFSRFSVGSFFWDRSQQMSDVYDYYKEYVEKAESSFSLASAAKFCEKRLQFSKEILNNFKDEMEEE
jgi:hypothetical protein